MDNNYFENSQKTKIIDDETIHDLVKAILIGAAGLGFKVLEKIILEKYS